MQKRDVIFGKNAATFKFVSQADVQKGIQELGCLRAMGIQRKIAQVFFERGLMTQDQIYAVFESMIQSGQLKNLFPLTVTSFTDEDDKEFLDFATTKGKEFISTDDINSTFKLKQELNDRGYPYTLLSLMVIKGFITSEILKSVPELCKKITLLVDPKERTKERVMRNTSFLYGQIGILQKKLTHEEVEKNIKIWIKIHSMGIGLRFSEILYLRNVLDEKNTGHIASLLKSVTGINEYPRLSHFHVSDEEDTFFQEVVEKGKINRKRLEECVVLSGRLATEGVSMRLSDLFIIKGYLTRPELIKRWEAAKKKEIAEKAREIEKSDPVKAKSYTSELSAKMTEQVRKTQEIIKKHQKASIIKPDDAGFRVISTPRETIEMEIEFTKQLKNEIKEKRKAVKGEIKNLKKQLKTADPSKTKEIEEKLRSYREAKAMTLYIGIAVFLCILFIWGTIYLAKNLMLPTQKDKSTERYITVTKKDILEKYLNIKGIVGIGTVVWWLVISAVIYWYSTHAEIYLGGKLSFFIKTWFIALSCRLISYWCWYRILPAIAELPGTILGMPFGNVLPVYILPFIPIPILNKLLFDEYELLDIGSSLGIIWITLLIVRSCGIELGIPFTYIF